MQGEHREPTRSTATMTPQEQHTRAIINQAGIREPGEPIETGDPKYRCSPEQSRSSQDNMVDQDTTKASRQTSRAGDRHPEVPVRSDVLRLGTRRPMMTPHGPYGERTRTQQRCGRSRARSSRGAERAQDPATSRAAEAETEDNETRRTIDMGQRRLNRDDPNATPSQR